MPSETFVPTFVPVSQLIYNDYCSQNVTENESSQVEHSASPVPYYSWQQWEETDNNLSTDEDEFYFSTNPLDRPYDVLRNLYWSEDLSEDENEKSKDQE